MLKKNEVNMTGKHMHSIKNYLPKRDKQIGLSANLSNQRNANGDILMSKDKHHGDKLRAY